MSGSNSNENAWAHFGHFAFLSFADIKCLSFREIKLAARKTSVTC
jgi:hypothetical protein